MEMKMYGSGDAAPGAGRSAKCKKRAPIRLQKHAPALLQLEQGAGTGPAAALGDGRAPIPLVSLLVVLPIATPIWEADQQSAAGARRDGDAEGRGNGEQLLRGAAAGAGSASRTTRPRRAPGIGLLGMMAQLAGCLDVSRIFVR